MNRRFRLWIGVCAAIAAIAVASFACAIKTRGVEFNQRMVGQASLPVKLENFASWLSVKIQDINNVIARQLDRSGTGTTACDGILVSQVTDDSPAHASGNVPTPVLERNPGFTQKAPQGGQKSGLEKFLHLGIASLKILVRVCLKKSRHAM